MWKEYILYVSWEADVRSALVCSGTREKEVLNFTAVGAKSLSVTLK